MTELRCDAIGQHHSHHRPSQMHPNGSLIPKKKLGIEFGSIDLPPSVRSDISVLAREKTRLSQAESCTEVDKVSDILVTLRMFIAMFICLDYHIG
jgi:hypothetical protein